MLQDVPGDDDDSDFDDQPNSAPEGESANPVGSNFVTLQ